MVVLKTIDVMSRVLGLFFLDNYAYCDSGWKIQKPDSFYCSEDFECRSGGCTSNICSSVNAQSTNSAELSGAGEAKNLGAITRLLLWIDNLL